MSKVELNVFSDEFLHVCEEERYGKLSPYKSLTIKSIWEPPFIVSFAHCRSTTETVLRYLWPRFHWDKKSNRAFAKDLSKTGNIAGVLDSIGNGKKQISHEQMKKLFDSGELGRTKSKNPAQLQRTT